MGLGGLEVDEAMALQLYKLSAHQGYAEAQATLGNMYIIAEGGVEENVEEGLRLLHLAASQGNDRAILTLSYLKEISGEDGLDRDKIEAMKYYQHAADHAPPEELYRLGLLHAEDNDHDGR